MKSFVLLLTLCLACPSTLLAYEYYIATSDLNVRSGAGKTYPVSFSLRKGDTVELVSENGKWYEIRYSDKVGFAYSKFLSRSSDSENMSYESDESFGSKAGILALLLIGFVWILPLLIIVSSSKTTSGEKIAWLLAVLFISWLAWIFYALLAPIKQSEED